MIMNPYIQNKLSQSQLDHMVKAWQFKKYSQVMESV